MGKGEQTRTAVLDRAVELASAVGLEGLSIGRLAGETRLSKSGLFAHFESKEDLQVRILERAAERFAAVVSKPALAARRGEPRVRELFERWMRWGLEVSKPGGCIFVAASVELDDRPGPARDRLAQLQGEWLDFVAGAVRIAKDEGHFRPEVDPQQFAFETYGIALMTHLAFRLLRDGDAVRRARLAFERLLESARAS
ncbi:MAG TPA: TetR/AcrR family transcriptional regulator [Anaeromyxobacteraceae bacterium]|nr:TetR/AcrR family transcriptional regulator [Anaeromyxobacteraceae bacterium]